VEVLNVVVVVVVAVKTADSEAVVVGVVIVEVGVLIVEVGVSSVEGPSKNSSSSSNDVSFDKFEIPSLV